MSHKSRKSHDRIERVATKRVDDARTRKQPYASEQEDYGGGNVRSPKTETNQSTRTETSDAPEETDKAIR